MPGARRGFGVMDRLTRGHGSPACFTALPTNLVLRKSQRWFGVVCWSPLDGPLSRRGVALPFVYRATAQPLQAGEYLDVVGD